MITNLKAYTINSNNLLFHHFDALETQIIFKEWFGYDAKKI
jgi:hypothetical protein